MRLYSVNLVSQVLALALISGPLLTFAGPGYAQGAPGGQMPPQQVGVMTMTKQNVPQSFSLPGRAVAFQQVMIRPRVGGIVTEIVYTPGQAVKVGDPLFKLDDASYVANVATANSAFLKAQADLPVKQAAVNRSQKLLGQGSTQVQLESDQSALAAAKATLEATTAALVYAQAELSWTTISSPIDGFPEVAAVSVGDLVSAGQAAAMTMITRLDPVYVDMLETSSRLLQIRKQIDNGTLAPNRSINAILQLEDGEIYNGAGRLVAPSSIVSTTSGTFSVRFEFPNPDHKILPGMFVQGTADLGISQAYLVPERAAQRSNSGDLTAFIVKDGKSQLVSLNAISAYQNNWVVTSGLAEGDQLIVDGLKTMSPGQPVNPVAVVIDADGLTQPATASPVSTPASPSPAGVQPAATAPAVADPTAPLATPTNPSSDSVPPDSPAQTGTPAKPAQPTPAE